jgi:2-isopropylmalate synthase
MTNEQKHRFFRHLVQIGFKEIEVAYPAASEPDFNFVRELRDGPDVPDDVWIQVGDSRSSLMKGSYPCKSRLDQKDV